MIVAALLVEKVHGRCNVHTYDPARAPNFYGRVFKGIMIRAST
jgi:hypothetical protein